MNEREIALLTKVAELEAEARCLHIEVNSLAEKLGWNMQISLHKTAIAVMRSAIAAVPGATTRGGGDS